MACRAGGRLHPGPRKFFAAQLDALLEFAGHQFELEQREDDGSTYRSHLQVAALHSATAAEELLGPPCPEELHYIWEWFLDLCAARGGSGFGANPLPWSEIEAWARLSRVELLPYERRTLSALDHCYLGIAAAKK